MEKIEEKLLEDFKKSNKERKEKLAKRYGFDSAEEYLKELETNLFGEVPKIVEEKKATEKSDVLTDIVIAFDTTGSMASYISAVKTHVTQVIPELFKNTKNLQISIVAFGDYCDMRSDTIFGDAYQVINLTDSPSKLMHFVNCAKNTGGGDSAEFYELVLQKIKNETNWRKDSNKSILLIADDEPHSLGYSYGQRVRDNQIDWKKEAKELKELGIKVDTLSIHGQTWYEELSSITDGLYLRFKSSEKTQTLLEGYAYARSGSTESFMTMTSTVTASGDEELIGVYKQLGTL